jgi:hypothetical protein
MRGFNAARRLSIAAALVGGCAVAAMLPAASVAGTGARAATAGPCSSSGLVIWLDTSSNGAAGSLFFNLKFTNLSGHTCTLRGYPGVSAIDLSGHRIGSPAGKDNGFATRTVTLRNGHTATSELRIVENGDFPPSICGPVTAAGLRVFAPNTTRSKTIPFPFGACSKPGSSVLTVRVVR